MDYSQLSIIEVVYNLILESAEPCLATDVIKKALELKNIADPTGEITNQAYMDLNDCGLFVYCGEGKWDLKSNQPLSVFDRDGSAYANVVDNAQGQDENQADSDVEEELDEDEEYDDEDEYDDEEDEDDEYDQGSYDEDYDETDDDDEQDYLDEEEYNDIMDDYEDMYDNN